MYAVNLDLRNLWFSLSVSKTILWYLILQLKTYNYHILVTSLIYMSYLKILLSRAHLKELFLLWRKTAYGNPDRESHGVKGISDEKPELSAEHSEANCGIYLVIRFEYFLIRSLYDRMQYSFDAETIFCCWIKPWLHLVAHSNWISLSLNDYIHEYKFKLRSSLSQSSHISIHLHLCLLSTYDIQVITIDKLFSVQIPEME